ncbi:MAG: hypothetical protein ACOCWI_03920 [Bacillota bacterium]
MKKNLFKNISKVLLFIMLALCMLSIIGGCQSKKQLDLNNYQKYISVSHDATFEAKNGNLMIVDYIVFQKVNDYDKLFDVLIKCSYVINGSEGEFTENLGNLNWTYKKEIEIQEESSHMGQVRVLEISGTAQRGINFDKMTPIFVVAAIFLIFLGILGPFIFYGLRFLANFNKIQIGMSYSKVIEILDEPSSSSQADNILTCVWRKYVLRGWIIVRAVTFKDDTVISKTN